MESGEQTSLGREVNGGSRTFQRELKVCTILCIIITITIKLYYIIGILIIYLFYLGNENELRDEEQ